MSEQRDQRILDFIAVAVIFGGMFMLAACAGIAYLIHNYATS